MSQTWNVPTTSGAGGSTAISNLHDAVASLRSSFSGTSKPSSPVAGQPFYDTDDDLWEIYDGSAWVTLFPDTSVAGGGLLALTGGTMSGAIAMGSNKITGGAAASAAADFTIKSQIDARVRETVIPIGDLSASSNFYVRFGLPAITVVDCYVIHAGSTTSSDGSNKWAFQVQNLTDAHGLKATAYDTDTGSELVADTAQALGLDQNLSVDANDVLEFQATLMGSPGNLTDAAILLRYTLAT